MTVKKAKNKKGTEPLPKPPLPQDYKISEDTKSIIDLIEKAVLSETNDVRKLVLYTTIFFSVIPILVIITVLEKPTSGGDVINSILLGLVILGYPLLALFMETLNKDSLSFRGTELQDRYSEFSSDLRSYQKENNQYEYPDTEYVLAEELSKYLSYEEKRILNWGLHFSASKDNMMKLLKIGSLSIEDTSFHDAALKERYKISIQDVLFELDNLPHSIGEVYKVFVKSERLAIDHKLEDAHILPPKIIVFNHALEKLQELNENSYKTVRSMELDALMKEYEDSEH